MSLKDYIVHYLEPKTALLMLIAATVSIVLSLVIIQVFSHSASYKKAHNRRERFYELMFSSTTILMFVGIYFQMDFFGVGATGNAIWAKYNSFILLGFILASVMLNSFLDSYIIPLNHTEAGERAAMRLIGMLYMLIIFAYIKFIYQDDNYDSIIMYFVTLVIGRFVYFDASMESFTEAMRKAFRSLSFLILALMCSGIMAYVGFSSGYLLRANGVVMNLFIAHLYLLAVIFVVHWITQLIMFFRKDTDEIHSQEKIS